jgi:hypothetical protein
MDDKLMLVMAAGAAGIELEWVRPFVSIGDFAMVPHNAETGDHWNPLCNDGDAFRLAVNLRIAVSQFPFGDAHAQWDHGACMEPHNGDPCAATRRAIVRAAAALAAPPTDKGATE